MICDSKKITVLTASRSSTSFYISFHCLKERKGLQEVSCNGVTTVRAAAAPNVAFNPNCRLSRPALIHPTAGPAFTPGLSIGTGQRTIKFTFSQICNKVRVEAKDEGCLVLVSSLSPHRGQHSLGGAASAAGALVRRVIV